MEIWLQPCVLHQSFKANFFFFFFSGTLAEMVWHFKFGCVYANIPDGSSWLSCQQIDAFQTICFLWHNFMPYGGLTSQAEMLNG